LRGGGGHSGGFDRLAKIAEERTQKNRMTRISLRKTQRNRGKRKGGIPRNEKGECLRGTPSR